MLGEDHSLINEFPEHKEKIVLLNQDNLDFAKDAKRYHALDSEIRGLELDNGPIEDESLHKLKQQRALLKDTLYRQLLSV